jgi:hypothetical protein
VAGQHPQLQPLLLLRLLLLISISVSVSDSVSVSSTIDHYHIHPLIPHYAPEHFLVDPGTLFVYTLNKGPHGMIMPHLWAPIYFHTRGLRPGLCPILRGPSKGDIAGYGIGPDPCTPLDWRPRPWRGAHVPVPPFPVFNGGPRNPPRRGGGRTLSLGYYTSKGVVWEWCAFALRGFTPSLRGIHKMTTPSSSHGGCKKEEKCA